MGEKILLGQRDGILPGEICKSCIHLIPAQGIPPCPWGNSKYPDKTTMFVGTDGTPGDKCFEYKTYEDIGIEAETETTLKVEAMNDTQLNVAMYRKIQALDEKNRKKLYNYWNYLFPRGYAKDMVTDDNESEPHQNVIKKKPKKDKPDVKKRKKNKFYDGFERTEEEDKSSLIEKRLEDFNKK